MARRKQFWSVEETKCLLKTWSGIQQHMDGSALTKDLYEEIQSELARHGYKRKLEQIINKIKKLKREYREQGECRDYWVKRNPYFETLEMIISNSSNASEQPEEPEDNTVLSADADTPKFKHMWSMMETTCLLSIWSSTDTQEKIDRPTMTKKIFEDIQNEMAAQGYNRTVTQIINKIKSLKKEYKAHKDNPGQVKNPWTKARLEALEFCIDDTATDQQMEPHVTDSVAMEAEEVLQSSTDNELPIFDDVTSTIKMEPTDDMIEFSIDPVLHSPHDVKTEDVEPDTPPRQGKRKRQDNSDMLEHLESLHEKYLQHSKEMHETFFNKMDAHMTAIHGLMERMVTAMEAKAGRQTHTKEPH